MVEKYIERTLEPVIRRACKEFPAIVLTGPRQSGKTTLLKQKFEKSHQFVSLESLEMRDLAIKDPRAFLKANPPPVILDEIQYAPDLLSYIKMEIDDHRDKNGQFILTGSQNLLLIQRVSESLVGRAAILKLLPLSFNEITGFPQDSFPWEADKKQNKNKLLDFKAIWEQFIRGCYPDLVAHPKKDIELWHSSYILLYLERDVREIQRVNDLILFQNFIRILAARSGQLLNLKDIASNLGVSISTIKGWLSILESTFQIIILHPYYENVGKRLVKTPKVYFTDVGTLCYLTGLKDPLHAFSGPMGGVIFESVVFSELFKGFAHRGLIPRIHFWRTSHGEEVDFIIEINQKLIPIEVKLSMTPRIEMASSIKKFMKDYPKKASNGYVIHPGDIKMPLSDSVVALPFSEL